MIRVSEIHRALPATAHPYVTEATPRFLQADFHRGMWMQLEVKLLVGRTTLIVDPLSELERGGTKGQYNRVCNQLSEQSLGSHLTWLSPEFIH